MILLVKYFWDNMLKYYFTIVVAFLLISFVSCQEGLVPESEKEIKTKSSLNGDRIAISMINDSENYGFITIIASDLDY